MKRTIAFMMALALCVGTTATAFAEDTATEFSFTLRNDPTYTVTIPAQVTIEKDGTDVEVVAEDVENLAENEKISVTIAGTDYFRNQMVLTDKDTRAVMRYQIVTPRVIGKQGRIAKAIRVVMRAAATRTNSKISVEID